MKFKLHAEILDDPYANIPIGQTWTRLNEQMNALSAEVERLRQLSEADRYDDE